MPAAWEREKSLFHETAGKTPADLAVFVDNKGVPALPRQHRDLRAVLHRGKFIRAGLIAEIDAAAVGGLYVPGLIIVQPAAAFRLLQLGRRARKVILGRTAAPAADKRTLLPLLHGGGADRAGRFVGNREKQYNGGSRGKKKRGALKNAVKTPFHFR